MKKRTLILCTVLTTISLSALGFMNWNTIEKKILEIPDNKTVDSNNDYVTTTNEKVNTNLFFDLHSRYIHTITKEKLDKAKSIGDIIPNHLAKKIEAFQTFKVSILDSNKEISEVGENNLLNASQIKLLQSANYSTNISISASYRAKDTVSPALKEDYLVCYMTIIPEEEAEYIFGNDVLVEYLKENSKEKTLMIDRDKLRPGKISFTVTGKGTISNVRLMSTSGYPSMDKELIKLITYIPKWNWKSAINSKGEKVDQELVLFFGMEGC
ncbi:energy transducer TonB [Xanthovirga aplysinae]|uniref:energy transducer TonB n=1 Tax=Xanthovirga aplysinae TaxID=2529853 RepID=UPI0012BC3DC1|nr:hypothetical protein [Xanthovirga aplysinae]MTI31656.1 hypothetical protein [Xanthovirga aplysinae]